MSTSERSLGVLLLHSQSLAMKHGVWNYQHHATLERAFKELIELRDAVDRYGQRLRHYRTTVQEVIDELQRGNKTL